MARAAYGWANEGWSASTDFILAAFEAVKLTEGPILECGSGLSTILVAVAAEELGREVWSLEHEPDWAERVRAELRRHRIASARVLTCGLKDYGEFAWYELPPENLPRDFDLVVCDGPPADTPGGRIGLLPLLADHLRPGCVILLDDTSRAVERNILEGWAEQLGCTALRFGPDESIGYLQKPRA